MANHHSKPSYHLPEEIVYAIILRLPLKSIARFKLASKHWNTLLSNPHFMNDLNISRRRRPSLFSDHLLFFYYKYSDIYNIECTNLLDPHHHHHKMRNFSPLTTPHELQQFEQTIPGHKRHHYHLKLSSCNGLLLVTNQDYLDFVLWNPLTRESMSVDATSWKNFRDKYYLTWRTSPRWGWFEPYYDYSVLLSDRYNHRISYDIKVFALCYNASRDEYTVLLLLTCRYLVAFRDKDEHEHMRVFLLNCKTGELKGQDYRGSRNMCSRAFSVTIVCGAPHWLTDLCVPSDLWATTRNEILYFDTDKERLRRMVMPSRVGKERTELLGLGALNGQSQLGIVVNNVVESCYEVWVMKEYGMSDSWTKMFVISPNSVTTLDNNKNLKSLDVLGYIRSTGELIMDVNKQGLVVCDPRDNNCRRSVELWDYGYRWKHFFITAHEPSLVAPPRADPSESKNYDPSMIGHDSVLAIFGHDPVLDMFDPYLVPSTTEHDSMLAVLQHDRGTLRDIT